MSVEGPGGQAFEQYEDNERISGPEGTSTCYGRGQEGQRTVEVVEELKSVNVSPLAQTDRHIPSPIPRDLRIYIVHMIVFFGYIMTCRRGKGLNHHDRAKMCPVPGSHFSVFRSKIAAYGHSNTHRSLVFIILAALLGHCPIRVFTISHLVSYSQSDSGHDTGQRFCPRG
jgi:hypothetical protein